MADPDQTSEDSTLASTSPDRELRVREEKPLASPESDLPTRADGKVELHEADAYDKLGFSFPRWQKWMILCVVFAVQTSMNFNASIYGNAVKPLVAAFPYIDEAGARVGQMIFLVAYAFGCELWAPWSEEIGRWPVMQASLFLVNVWQIPCALAPNFNTIIAFRFLGGLSSAGGSVTLGMIADLFESDNQQFAVAFIVLSSVGGSALGPIVGGFTEKFQSWQWIFWLQLIFGGAVQLTHALLVPETRATLLLDREAKKRRKAGQSHIYGPNELREGPRIAARELIRIWSRPFEMFLREPIVLCLSLLSGFSDALIFIFLESYTPVFKQWGFDAVTTGLAFIPIIVGYFIAYASFLPFFARDGKIRKRDPDALQPETRLYWLLYMAPLETIGLFGFAWTSLGPPRVHWIAPMIFSALIGMANYAIYMATIDYMIEAYGPYSASATGGNGFARDFLAGVSAMYSVPFYSNIPGYTLEYPTTILACIAILVTIPIYIFYWKGPTIRKNSKFAQELASDFRKRNERRRSTMASLPSAQVA